MKKNILIIGGSGFLGSHVSDEFSKKNYKVTIIDKKKSKGDSRQLTYTLNKKIRIIEDITQ